MYIFFLMFVYIVPLLISKTACFDFNNLKDACTSIRPTNSSVLFNEIVRKILSSKETQHIREVSIIIYLHKYLY